MKQTWVLSVYIKSTGQNKDNKRKNLAVQDNVKSMGFGNKFWLSN